MFGKNPIRDNENKLDGSELSVQEVFYTIQGEGPYSGCPASFIRLAGCNLACLYCDTEFESNINNRLRVDEIVAQVREHPHRDLVVLTGGEPMRQNIVPLINALLACGVKTIQIETAGTLWQPDLAPYCDRLAVVLVCSPKTPRIHAAYSRHCHHFKYVVEIDGVDPDDGLPTKATQVGTLEIPIRQRLARPWELFPITKDDVVVWVSPCDAHDVALSSANQRAAVHVAMKHNYRLSLQTHKLVGLP